MTCVHIKGLEAATLFANTCSRQRLDWLHQGAYGMCSSENLLIASDGDPHAPLDSYKSTRTSFPSSLPVQSRRMLCDTTGAMFGTGPKTRHVKA